MAIFKQKFLIGYKPFLPYHLVEVLDKCKASSVLQTFREIQEGGKLLKRGVG